MARLQQALDAEWETFQHSTDGGAALARWATEDQRYARFDHLGELRSYFERRDDVEARDLLMADLLCRCPDDAVARRVMLAALRPGLRRLTRRASAFWDPEEAESIIVAAAVDRLADRTIGFPIHAASGVLGSVWKSAWACRKGERMEESYWGGRADPALLDAMAAVTDSSQVQLRAARRGSSPQRCGAGAGRSAHAAALGPRLHERRAG